MRDVENEYDASNIVGIPHEKALGLTENHKFIVCSDFPRSIQSAKALCAKSINFSSEIFREMNPPYLDNLPIKMPLENWVTIFRILWYLGFSKNTESYSDAKDRAKQASGKLIELAGTHHSVLFVGHGLFNQYVAKELLRRNWSGPPSPGKKYWEFGTYNYAKI